MKAIHYIYILVAMFTLATSLTANAQFQTETGNSEVLKKQKKVKVEPSYAWSLSEPLGLHYESTIDTLFLNYHKASIPSHQSNAWQLLVTLVHRVKIRFSLSVNHPVSSSSEMLLRVGCQALRLSVTTIHAFP